MPARLPGPCTFHILLKGTPHTHTPGHLVALLCLHCSLQKACLLRAAELLADSSGWPGRRRLSASPPLAWRCQYTFHHGTPYTLTTPYWVLLVETDDMYFRTCVRRRISVVMDTAHTSATGAARSTPLHLPHTHHTPPPGVGWYAGLSGITRFPTTDLPHLHCLLAGILGFGVSRRRGFWTSLSLAHGADLHACARLGTWRYAVYTPRHVPCAWASPPSTYKQHTLTKRFLLRIVKLMMVLLLPPPPGGTTHFAGLLDNALHSLYFACLAVDGTSLTAASGVCSISMCCYGVGLGVDVFVELLPGIVTFPPPSF